MTAVLAATTSSLLSRPGRPRSRAGRLDRNYGRCVRNRKKCVDESDRLALWPLHRPDRTTACHRKWGRFSRCWTRLCKRPASQNPRSRLSLCRNCWSGKNMRKARENAPPTQARLSCYGAKSGDNRNTRTTVKGPVCCAVATMLIPPNAPRRLVVREGQLKGASSTNGLFLFR
jgi:hypothetical protein